jgi:hypothetical protein
VPPKTDNPRRNKILAVFTDDEYEIILRAANKVPATKSTFVREAALTQAAGFAPRSERPPPVTVVRCQHGVAKGVFCFRCRSRV